MNTETLLEILYWEDLTLGEIARERTSSPSRELRNEISRCINYNKRCGRIKVVDVTKNHRGQDASVYGLTDSGKKWIEFISGDWECEEHGVVDRMVKRSRLCCPDCGRVLEKKG